MKLLHFYFSNNEKSEREIKESIPFTTATKRIKYVGINLPKETKELYTENPKGSIRKLLELISEFSKVAGYKINTQKSVVFLYTKNERTGREILEAIPFIITSKRIKYLEIKLTKETKDPYSENWKMLIN